MRTRLLLMFLATLLSACGNVVIEEGGSGGSISTAHGSSGSKPSQGTEGAGATMSTGTVDTSTATGPDPALCDNFCAVASCLNGCHHACNAYQNAPCQAEGAMLIACLTSHFDSMVCQGSGCDAEMLAFTQCHSSVPQDCNGSSGSGGGTECADTEQCAGGIERTVCDINDGVAKCTCYLSYISIGVCSESVPTDGPPNPPANLDVCSPEKGCCSQFFGT
jgi:hypothetical protein